MKLKETETIELKKSTSELKEAIISISAILNKQGRGTVYFGIEDDGTVVGQQIGKATVKDISKSISDHIDPKIYPEIKVQNISGKDCVLVDFIGHEPLYSAFGRFYLRAGEEDKKLAVNEIERLIEKKKNYVYSWGSEVSGTPVSASDVATLRSFIKRGKEAGRISFSFDSAKNVLTKLNLVKGDKLFNAGKALFCKSNGVEIQAAVFAGKDKITFLDIQRFTGTLFDLAEKSETYLKEHINWRADLSGSRRIEIPEIPVRALMEAIINSLCHRDFANPKSNEIAIYRDRIEIFNPGQFPYEYSPNDFIKGNKPSIPRNPLVAETLYLSEDIEKWGSGLRRINEECKAAGVRVEFEKIKSGFQVVFYRPIITLEQGRRGKNAGVAKVESQVESKVESRVESLNEKVLRFLSIAPMSKAEISINLGRKKPYGQLHEAINRLLSENKIERTIPDKPNSRLQKYKIREDEMEGKGSGDGR